MKTTTKGTINMKITKITVGGEEWERVRCAYSDMVCSGIVDDVARWAGGRVYTQTSMSFECPAVALPDGTTIGVNDYAYKNVKTGKIRTARIPDDVFGGD